eukprot:COSAG01_NODE_27816_length_676_cov_0.944541_2_plen_41_part_01
MAVWGYVQTLEVRFRGTWVLILLAQIYYSKNSEKVSERNIK